MSTTFDQPIPQRVAAMATPKLGEELPIFCEKCGYSLHGLPQIRCAVCEILHFHCPECGHHQPINTLRPAFQRMLGKTRAMWLALVVLFKLNFFGWLLFAWLGMGAAWSSQYSYSIVGNKPTYRVHAMELDLDVALGFGLFALSFGMVGRMLLLRWKNGAAVGIVLAALAVAAICTGIGFQSYSMHSAPYDRTELPQVGSLWNIDWLYVLIWTAGLMVIGSATVFPIWVGFVRVLIPAKYGRLLIEWQRSLSDRSIASLGRE